MSTVPSAIPAYIKVDCRRTASSPSRPGASLRQQRRCGLDGGKVYNPYEKPNPKPVRDWEQRLAVGILIAATFSTLLVLWLTG